MTVRRMTATVVPAHEVVCHCRDQRARQRKGANEGKDDGFGHGPEEVAGDATKLKHRYENNAEAQQCDESRHDNLPGAVQDGSLNFLSLLKMPVDVLDRNSSVVDEDADR